MIWEPHLMASEVFTNFANTEVSNLFLKITIKFSDLNRFNNFQSNDKLYQIDNFTYTTREMTALLKPLKSKSLKFKLIETGLLPPCAISIRLMRNGSIGGIDRPVWPFGYFWTISVITFGKQTVSPTLHCGISAAITTTSK